MDMGERFAEAMGVRIISHRLPGLLVAATDGTTIYVDDRLTQRERRCAIHHELVHIELGHRECQPAAVEKKVRALTADRLVSWQAVWDHAPWAHSLDELAEDLNVTRSVLADWIAGLPEDARMVLQMRFECAA